MNRYAITINSWTTEDLMAVLRLPTSYQIIGIETTQSGVPHLQIYIEIEKNFMYLQKALPRAHIERARKGREANIAYCKKSGKFIEDARPSFTGARTVTKV